VECAAPDPLRTTIELRRARQTARRCFATRARRLANGKNPIPVIVPCHRVVEQKGADGIRRGTGYEAVAAGARGRANAVGRLTPPRSDLPAHKILFARLRPIQTKPRDRSRDIRVLEDKGVCCRTSGRIVVALDCPRIHDLATRLLERRVRGTKSPEAVNPVSFRELASRGREAGPRRGRTRPSGSTTRRRLYVPRMVHRDVRGVLRGRHWRDDTATTLRWSYLCRNTILPRVKSYGDNASVTRSPASTRI